MIHCAPHSALILIASDGSLRLDCELCVSAGKMTHQGSRNMVATLNPIRVHMSMKTGRLLGKHATVATAGMKS